MAAPEATLRIVGVPKVSRRHLSRPRLLELLDPHVPLTVLRGVASSGKSALLSEWARSLRISGLWVSMGADVHDRVGYWRTVITAMDDAGQLDPDSPLREDLQPRTLRRALVRGFSRLPGRHVLIIDNSDVLDPQIDAD